MNARTEFLKGFAAFHGIDAQEADKLWMLYSARLPADERREAEQMGYPMGYSTAELYAHLFRDTEGQEQDSPNVINFPSP